MKAIQTVFNGTVFRSRLEARWAAVFSALGVEWVYEPEGYEHDGQVYLPDFCLIPWNVFVAIKPKVDESKEYRRELWWQAEMSANGIPMWIIAGSPTPNGYRAFGSDGIEIRLMDCRKCGGVSYELADGSGWGEIGIHTCGDHDKWPADTTRLDAALLCAMRERFGERGSGAVKMGLKVGAKQGEGK